MTVSLPALLESLTRAPGGRTRLRRRHLLAGSALLLSLPLTEAAHLAWQQSSPVPTGTLIVQGTALSVGIAIDGRAAGKTPAALRLSAGDHDVSVIDARYLPATYRVRVAPDQSGLISVEAWRTTPAVRAIHPSFPGATIASADFLADGRVTLTETVPPGTAYQAWILDSGGRMSEIGPRGVGGPIAISPDATRVASLEAAPSSSVGPRRRNVVHLVGADGETSDRRYALPLGVDEDAVDLSWLPTGGRLVIAARQVAPDAHRTRLFALEAQTSACEELAVLPTETVSGSFTGSPDGRQVAFLTRTGSLTSLCLLDLDGTGQVSYLADLANGATTPLPFPPVTWSSDGQHLYYAAPASDPSGPTGWLFGAKPMLSLYEASPSHPFATLVADDAGGTPVWRPGGSILTTRTGRGGALTLRELTPDRARQDVGTIAVSVRGSYAIRWDPRHARALVVGRSTSPMESSVDQFWLVDFGSEVTR